MSMTKSSLVPLSKTTLNLSATKTCWRSRTVDTELPAQSPVVTFHSLRPHSQTQKYYKLESFPIKQKQEFDKDLQGDGKHLIPVKLNLKGDEKFLNVVNATKQKKGKESKTNDDLLILDEGEKTHTKSDQVNTDRALLTQEDHNENQNTQEGEPIHNVAVKHNLTRQWSRNKRVGADPDHKNHFLDQLHHNHTEENLDLMHGESQKLLILNPLSAMARSKTKMVNIPTKGVSHQKQKPKRCKLITWEELKIPIKNESRFRTRWDITIILLSFWVTLMLPVQIAFEPEQLDQFANQVLNRIIDMMFFFDIVVNFRTTFKHHITGEEISDNKQIALGYLKSRFIIDLVATIPLDLLAGLDEDRNRGNIVAIQVRIVQIFKLSRILRFTKIISFLNATENVKLSLKLFKLIFYLIIYIHLQACAWFYYTKQDRTWYPITDIIKDEYHFYDHGFYHTYCFSIWHSTQILDGADMVPATGHQAIVISILVILSEFIHAHILGTIEVVLLALNRKSAKFQESVEFATSTMKNIKLSHEIQEKIIEYLTVKQNDLDAQKELDNLMSMISPNLKSQITQHLFLKALQSIQVFSQSNEVIEFILSDIEALQFMPEDFIVRQGQKATHMYILASGECDVLVKDQFKKDSFVGSIGPGTLFGEVSLLFNTKRTSSVRSRDQCSVGAISAESFKELVQFYPDIEKNLIENTRSYKDHWKSFQIETLDQVPYFKDLPFDQKEEIHYKFQLENYDKGAKLISKDQECEGIYFLLTGHLDLFVEREGKEFHLDTLVPGCTLGTYSIFNETPFVFSAKARTNISLLFLQRDDLLDLAEKFPDLSTSIEINTEFLLYEEIPECDYFFSIDPCRDTFGLTTNRVEIFKRAVRRLIALNRGREIKKMRFIELIKHLKEMKQSV